MGKPFAALLLAATLVMTGLPRQAAAHPLGFSGFRFLIWQDKAKAIFTLHTRDMGEWFPPRKYPDYVAGVCRDIILQPSDLLEVQFDGEPVQPTEKRSFSPETGMIQIELTYPITKFPMSVSLWSRHLIRLPSGHQQLLFVEDMRPNPGGESGPSLYEAALSTEGDGATIEIPQSTSLKFVPSTSPTTLASASTQPSPSRSTTPPRRISFFALGVRHIVTGYDHLLFLAALLLVCKTFRQAAAVITFFTVAHSITLTLAALDIVRMPARIVEPAIAASILYVGIENIVGKHRFLWRATITFGFGLVHGLGFASALREAGLGSSSVGLAMPLLKFSIGLETGQLCIAAMLLRILLTLRHRPRFELHWVPACSILISLIGGYWLVERIIAG